MNMTEDCLGKILHALVTQFSVRHDSKDIPNIIYLLDEVGA